MALLVRASDITAYVTQISSHAAADLGRLAPAQERPTGAAWPSVRSLRMKLVFAGALWVALVIGLLTAAGLGFGERRLEEDLRETARLTAVAVADDVELRADPPGSVAVTSTLHDFLDAATSVRDIALFTLDDGVLHQALGTSSAPAPMPDPLIKQAVDTMRTVAADRGEQRTAVATPVMRDGRVAGAVLVTASLEPIVRLRNQGRLLAAAIALFAILGITALIHVLLAGLERQHTMMREELWRARELATVGQTMANVAHQVGTPLNLVSAHVQLLQQELLGNTAAQRRLGIVSEQVTRVATTVRDLLDRVRPRAPERTLAPKPLLARLVENSQVLAGPQRVRVTLDAPDDLPPVNGDEVQLELALANLVANALDAMPYGGYLTVTCRAQPGAVVVEISDSGAGIPPELMERIFEPWVTTKPPGHGTGLGLSITRDVVQRAGGTIAAEPREGGGTTFRVTLVAAPGLA
jgi:signal transduction histidine kinase